jgi:hypothetical protein
MVTGPPTKHLRQSLLSLQLTLLNKEAHLRYVYSRLLFGLVMCSICRTVNKEYTWALLVAVILIVSLYNNKYPTITRDERQRTKMIRNDMTINNL